MTTLATTTTPATTVREFVAGIKGYEHSGFAAGVRWIEAHGGVRVADRRNTAGGPLVTYRVRLAGRDVLATWGLGGVRDPRLGTLPDEWRIVID